jgi:hypothetical protein
MYRVNDRLDIHNPCVDEQVARAGLCATTDLHTGRLCIRPAHHPGSCDFTERATVERLTWADRHPGRQ